jgi:hypothetical protein
MDRFALPTVLAGAEGRTQLDVERPCRRSHIGNCIIAVIVLYIAGIDSRPGGDLSFEGDADA